MTEKESKDLLLRDLCPRLPYRPICHITDENGTSIDDILTTSTIAYLMDGGWSVKPFLRPMSSLTEEEKEELLAKLPKKWNIEIDKFGDLYFDICEECMSDIELFTDIIDWLLSKHLDFRGLIGKGLAESTRSFDSF